MDRKLFAPKEARVDQIINDRVMSRTKWKCRGCHRSAKGEKVAAHPTLLTSVHSAKHHVTDLPLALLPRQVIPCQRCKPANRTTGVFFATGKILDRHFGKMNCKLRASIIPETQITTSLL